MNNNMKYLLKAAFAFFDILMLTIFVVVGLFNLCNGYPTRSIYFELFLNSATLYLTLFISA